MGENLWLKQSLPTKTTPEVHFKTSKSHSLLEKQYSEKNGM